MAIRKQVTRISKLNLDSERITHLGGDGWWYPDQLAIAFIKYKIYDFFIKTDDGEINITVKCDEDIEYLRIEPTDVNILIITTHP